MKDVVCGIVLESQEQLRHVMDTWTHVLGGESLGVAGTLTVLPVQTLESADLPTPWNGFPLVSTCGVLVSKVSLSVDLFQC